MKTEIDLRSKRYKSRRALLQPSYLALFMLAFFIIALTALVWGSTTYSGNLNAILKMERTALQLLELEAYPVYELATSLEKAARTAETIPILMQNNIPASYCLGQIQRTAISGEVKISSISINSHEIEISARSKAIHHATAFCEALEKLDFIVSASVISIELIDSSSYSFRVDGTYHPPGGVPAYDQEQADEG